VATSTDILDLSRLSLSSGEGRRLDLNVKVDPLEFGRQRYAPDGGAVETLLDVSHTTSGYALRLRYEARLEGPCMRCLEEASHTLRIDAREVDQPGGGAELSSPYVHGHDLNLRSWTRDALSLALPAQIVCREGCLGLCPVCGENLNTAGPDHGHESAPDPRWAALREITFE
jgi:uncharacterized protein